MHTSHQWKQTKTPRTWAAYSDSESSSNTRSSSSLSESKNSALDAFTNFNRASASQKHTTMRSYKFGYTSSFLRA